jgi:hypothetical protein
MEKSMLLRAPKKEGVEGNTNWSREGEEDEKKRQRKRRGNGHPAEKKGEKREVYTLTLHLDTLYPLLQPCSLYLVGPTCSPSGLKVAGGNGEREI